MNNRVLPFFALLVALGIVFAYIRPTWAITIAETKEMIASDDEALASASAYAARQSVLAAARDSIDPTDLSRLAVLLPDSVDNVGLILDLNALAARSGLSLSNVDVSVAASAPAPASSSRSAPAKQGPLGFIDLSLSAVGTYGALQTFLMGVEQSERLLDVQEIFVKGSDTGVYSYVMKLRIYWLR